MTDRHITRSGDDYAVAFAKLLPTGRAWPRKWDGVLMRVVRGLSQVWGYVEERASALLERESDPRTTLELLPDWERNFGLPDPCYAEPFTIGDRQKALVQRMTIEGGQSREFFIAAAASIGYTITITEYRPFMVGMDRVGDNRVYGSLTSGDILFDDHRRPIRDPQGNLLRDLPTTDDQVLSEYPYVLGPPENRFYWTVHVGNVRLTWFRVGGGGGQVGVDPHLRISIASDLECLLDRWAPAHTEIIYDYSGVVTPGPMSGTP